MEHFKDIQSNAPDYRKVFRRVVFSRPAVILDDIPFFNSSSVFLETVFLSAKIFYIFPILTAAAAHIVISP